MLMFYLAFACWRFQELQCKPCLSVHSALAAQLAACCGIVRALKSSQIRWDQQHLVLLLAAALLCGSCCSYSFLPTYHLQSACRFHRSAQQLHPPSASTCFFAPCLWVRMCSSPHVLHLDGCMSNPTQRHPVGPCQEMHVS